MAWSGFNVFSGPNAAHIPVNTDIAVEFREYVERLEKLSLHPADIGAADDVASPAAGTVHDKIIVIER